MFGTLQQRLPPLLRRAGILTKEAADVYLRETYIPEHNARFGKKGGRRLALRLCLIAARPWTRFVHSRGSRCGAGQLRVLVRQSASDTGAEAQPPLREGGGVGASISRRAASYIRWFALPGPLQSSRRS